MLERELGFSYAVSILRKASGRGKSRKAGGLISLQLPDQDDTFESAEVLSSYPALIIHMHNSYHSIGPFCELGVRHNLRSELWSGNLGDAWVCVW